MAWRLAYNPPPWPKRCIGKITSSKSINGVVLPALVFSSSIYHYFDSKARATEEPFCLTLFVSLFTTSKSRSKISGVSSTIITMPKTIVKTFHHYTFQLRILLRFASSFELTTGTRLRWGNAHNKTSAISTLQGRSSSSVSSFALI